MVFGHACQCTSVDVIPPAFAKSYGAAGASAQDDRQNGTPRCREKNREEK